MRTWDLERLNHGWGTCGLKAVCGPPDPQVWPLNWVLLIRGFVPSSLDSDKRPHSGIQTLTVNRWTVLLMLKSRGRNFIPGVTSKLVFNIHPFKPLLNQAPSLFTNIYLLSIYNVLIKVLIIGVRIMKTEGIPGLRELTSLGQTDRQDTRQHASRSDKENTGGWGDWMWNFLEESMGENCFYYPILWSFLKDQNFPRCPATQEICVSKTQGARLWTDPTTPQGFWPELNRVSHCRCSWMQRGWEADPRPTKPSSSLPSVNLFKKGQNLFLQ